MCGCYQEEIVTSTIFFLRFITTPIDARPDISVINNLFIGGTEN